MRQPQQYPDDRKKPNSESERHQAIAVRDDHRREGCEFKGKPRCQSANSRIVPPFLGQSVVGGWALSTRKRFHVPLLDTSRSPHCSLIAVDKDGASAGGGNTKSRSIPRVQRFVVHSLAGDQGRCSCGFAGEQRSSDQSRLVSRVFGAGCIRCLSAGAATAGGHLHALDVTFVTATTSSRCSTCLPRPCSGFTLSCGGSEGGSSTNAKGHATKR